MDSPGEEVPVGKLFQEKLSDQEGREGLLDTQLGGGKPGLMLVYMQMGERGTLTLTLTLTQVTVNLAPAWLLHREQKNLNP